MRGDAPTARTKRSPRTTAHTDLPRLAASSGKPRKVISAEQRAKVSAAMKKWHAKQGHKMSPTPTERTKMQLVDGFATIETTASGILMIVTQITPDMPSGSRTATVLMTPEQLAAILAPVGFRPIAA